MRSFSSLWYWITLAVMWSTASHWVMGVPFDLINRARKAEQGPGDDIAILAQINARRLLDISRHGGSWLIGAVCFALTILIMMSVVYRIELAQALLCMAAPLGLVGYLSLRLALRIETEAPSGAALLRLLMRHRFVVQLIGMLAIFFTALFGMYHNIR